MEGDVFASPLINLRRTILNRTNLPPVLLLTICLTFIQVLVITALPFFWGTSYWALWLYFNPQLRSTEGSGADKVVYLIKSSHPPWLALDIYH